MRRLPLLPGGLMLAAGLVWLVNRGGLADGPLCPAAEPPPPNGNAVVRGKAGTSEIVLTTTDRLAGAVHSLTWKGKEFIDSTDHGRQLQSAASFDCARANEFWAECFNPTEAGSRTDGTGEKSSSKLLRLSADGSELRTTTQMAFWLAPGEKSSGRPVLNDQILSEHLVSKRVRIGYRRLAHVIDYEVTFTVPNGERHTYAQFEALTGYMPPEFGRFWRFLPSSGKLEELDDGPGEQPYPVVFANEAGTHAMGVFSPDQPSPGYEKAGYGRFRFQAEKVVKWNCVFRVRSAKGVAAGNYRYRLFVPVGTLEDVRQALAALVAEFAGHGATIRRLPWRAAGAGLGRSQAARRGVTGEDGQKGFCEAAFHCGLQVLPRPKQPQPPCQATLLLIASPPFWHYC